MLLADLVFAFMWVTYQAFRMKPINRETFPENLIKHAKENEFPVVDVLICTADPVKEPLMRVVNTCLSVMAYDYPTQKLSFYVAEDGRFYAAICAAPAVALGSWGLLKEKKATCYPSFMEQLSSAATAVESIVQQDGKVVTSRGPGTAMEFSVALVDQLFGKDKANEVSGPLVMRPNHGDEYTVLELNPMEWTFDNCPKILVPVADGTEEMEATMIIDVLRRAKAEVVVASVGEKLEIMASRKAKLVADMLLEEAAKLSYDLIVLPGGLGGAQAFADTEKLVSLLMKQNEANRPYGAICASPALVLEPHGLLKGKKATAFPAMCNKLSDQSAVENRVVVDGNLITSRGPGTSMEFSLAIVEKLFGRKKALELAKTMVFVRP